MLKLQQLLQSFEEIIGWPYLSPGSNDQNGIDCSGAFVRAFRAQGASIYHGSNRIIRAHCRDVIQAASVKQLRPGMAVFKCRNNGAEPAEYKPGGRFYNPALVGNFYHIGLVVSVGPLRIIHATTPIAKVDTALGNWGWAGYLKDVNYTESGEGAMPDSGTEMTMEVHAANGLPVRMRQMPSATSTTLKKIEVGKTVLAKGQQGEWTQVNYDGTAGWMQTQFLRIAPNVVAPETGDMVQVPRALLADMRDKLDALLGVG